MQRPNRNFLILSAIMLVLFAIGLIGVIVLAAR